jgi:hypothetical protein
MTIRIGAPTALADMIQAKPASRRNLSLARFEDPFLKLRYGVIAPDLRLRSSVKPVTGARSVSGSPPRFAGRIYAQNPLPGSSSTVPNFFEPSLPFWRCSRPDHRVCPIPFAGFCRTAEAVRTVISLGARSPAPSSSQPAASWSRRTASRRLFGLAPAGVCRATPVTGGAVGSYPTLSPLPEPAVARGPSAVCSLLHCPSRAEARAQALPGNLSLEPGLSSATLSRAPPR